MFDTKTCPICGQDVEGDEGVAAIENMNVCDECKRYVCTDCYMPLEFMCEECFARKEA